MTQERCYLALVSRHREILNEPLVWCGEPDSDLSMALTAKGWRALTDVEAVGFRGVPRYASGTAYAMKHKLEQSGCCGALEVIVQDDVNRHLYVLFTLVHDDWHPTSKSLIRGGHNKAKSVLMGTLPTVDPSDLLVQHISSAYCQNEHYQAIAQLPLDEWDEPGNTFIQS